MSVLAIFLIFIIIPCAIALIVVLSKIRTGKEERPAVTEAPAVTAVPDTTAQEQNKDAGPQQNSIYVHTSYGTSYRCPYCDAENGSGVRVCEICGRDI